MKGYKAFHKGLRAFDDFRYEIGKEYTITGKLEICANGFHFCKNLIDVFAYYDFDEETVEIAEVEASGKIINEGTKYCAERIKIIKMVPWTDVYDSIKDRNCNAGVRNTGSYNTGNYNSGDCNSGDFSSGYRNTGSFNSGDCNSGYYNNGDRNTGSCNSGSANSGDGNTGNFNSGVHNIGHHNTGNFNGGHHNTGDHNTGNFNSGFFNTNEPTVRLFNKDSGMTFEEFFRLRINIYDLEESKAIIQNLPNFDAQVFYEATGIDWRAEVSVK